MQTKLTCRLDLCTTTFFRNLHQCETSLLQWHYDTVLKFIESLATSSIVHLHRQVRKNKYHIWQPSELIIEHEIPVIKTRNRISTKQYVNTGVNCHNFIKIKLNPQPVINNSKLNVVDGPTVGMLNAQSTRT